MSTRCVWSLQAAKGPGDDVRAVGSDIEAGEEVLPKGTVIGPAEVGLLATVGAAKLRVSSLLEVCDRISCPNAGSLGRIVLRRLEGAVDKHDLYVYMCCSLVCLMHNQVSSESRCLRVICCRCEGSLLVHVLSVDIDIATWHRMDLMFVTFCRYTGSPWLEFCQLEMNWWSLESRVWGQGRSGMPTGSCWLLLPASAAAR